MNGGQFIAHTPLVSDTILYDPVIVSETDKKLLRLTWRIPILGDTTCPI